jgi:transposase-like protein
MKKKKRTFTDEFKRQIVNECDNNTLYAVSKRYSISISTIRKWVQKHQSILDGAKKVGEEGISKEESELENIQEIKSVLFSRMETLAASSQKLPEIIAALEFIDMLLDKKKESEGNMSDLLNRLVNKTEEANR